MSAKVRQANAPLPGLARFPRSGNLPATSFKHHTCTTGRCLPPPRTFCSFACFAGSLNRLRREHWNFGTVGRVRNRRPPPPPPGASRWPLRASEFVLHVLSASWRPKLRRRSAGGTQAAAGCHRVYCRRHSEFIVRVPPTINSDNANGQERLVRGAPPRAIWRGGTTEQPS